MQERYPREQEFNHSISRYSYKNVQMVFNDAANIMFNYRSMTFYPFSYTDSGITRQQLEIRGDLTIKYLEKDYQIATSIKFPYLYPEIAPQIFLINPDCYKFGATSHYAKGSNYDGSLISMANLPELSQWGYHKSIQRVMTQLISQLSTCFPFYDKTTAPGYVPQNNQYQQPNYGQNIYNGYGQPPSYGGQPYPTTQPANQPPYGGQQSQLPYPTTQPPYPGAQPPYPGTQPPYPGTQPPYPGTQPPYPQQNNQVSGLYGQQQYGYNYQNQNQNPAMYEGQIRDKYIKAFEQETTPLVSEIKKQKTVSEFVLTTVCGQEASKKTLREIQNNLQKDIQSASYLQNMIKESVTSQEQKELNENTVRDFYQEEDQFSTSVINVLSDIEACRDTFAYIAEKFKYSNVTFEQLIKVTKLQAAQQFDQILLWQKYKKAYQ